MTHVLDASGVSKAFGSFQALKPMDFRLGAGEVRGLVGSNGAGKTTLVKILTGAHAATTGSVSVAGKTLPGGDPAAHIAGGIACIYQHSSLAPNLTVAENLFLGRHPAGIFGFVDRGALKRRAERLIIENRLDVSADDLVGALPPVKRKEVEILKALGLDSKVILMDEPTAWLSRREVARLHDIIRQLRARGVAIVYISHMMDEIFQICDTVSVMRDGVPVWEGEVADTDRGRIVAHMLGDGGGDVSDTRKTRAAGGPGILEVSGLWRKGMFQDIGFTLRKGEILCIGGLVGSGRTELARCLFGADRPDGGTIDLRGITTRIRSPRHAISLGIGFVPEDRHAQGLFLEHTIGENVIAAALPKFVRHMFFARSVARATADRAIDRLSVRPPDPDKVVGRLSGGNQQKVLLGKWLETEPEIIILDEPTVGVDVGAKKDIYDALQDLKRHGAAVLVVSSDVEEIQTIADRVHVMVAGRLGESLDGHMIAHADLVSRIGGEGGE